MGAFTDLFGRIPRVAFLEALLENADLRVSAPELARIAKVSRRSAYLFAARFRREGLITQSVDPETGTKKYALNEDDLRARSLALLERLVVLGGLETRLRQDRPEAPWTPVPMDTLPKLADSLLTTQIVGGPKLSLTPRPEQVPFDAPVSSPPHLLTMVASYGEVSTGFPAGGTPGLP